MTIDELVELNRDQALAGIEYLVAKHRLEAAEKAYRLGLIDASGLGIIAERQDILKDQWLAMGGQFHVEEEDGRLYASLWLFGARKQWEQEIPQGDSDVVYGAIRQGLQAYADSCKKPHPMFEMCQNIVMTPSGVVHVWNKDFGPQDNPANPDYKEPNGK